MKKINKIIALFLTLFVFVACDKEEEMLSINENNIKAEVKVSTENVTLMKDTEVADALTISMSQPNLGVSVTPSYKVIVKIGDKENKISLTGKKLEKVFSSVELNKLVLDLGAVAEEETNVEVVGIVELGAKHIVSQKKTVKVTPYAMKLDLTTTWGVVGSATPNEWNGPDLPMYKNTENAEEMVAYVTLKDGEIKFRENNDWGNNYGGQDGTLAKDGSNIAVKAGTYKITVNMNALTYKIESFTWGIVGSAAPNGWDGPDVALEYDPTSDMWKAVAKLKEGEIKFRQNNDWAVNLGLGDAEGTLKENGDNIPVKAGNYLVEVSLKDKTLKMTKIDFIWGIVGTINEWGNTGISDVKMSMDYSKEGVWYAKGVIVLKDGEIKFRANEDWSNNYGLGDSEGMLKENSSKNIPVKAGTYDITFDLSNTDAPTYKLEKR